MFGHEKGAFTGAHAAKPGLFEIAHGGTVFLDEVSGMSPNLQARLLRVLQERQVRRVGGTRFTHVDVRVIGASNQDLEDVCRKGTFREDFYYRLNVISMSLPPLRTREGDILLLANEFVTRFVQRVQTDSGSVPAIDPSAADLLMRYGWPGNVRELVKFPPISDTSDRLDVQSIGPSEIYDEVIEGGSGGLQALAGEFVFHCHIPQHYVTGMWGFWREYNTLRPGLPNRRHEVAGRAAGPQGKD